MNQQTSNTMTRRDVIQRVTALLGGVALAGGDRFLATAFDDEAIAQAMAQGVGAFSAADVAFLDEIAETILPETSSPGAKAAKTGAFMALMVTDAYTDRAREVFRTGMTQIDAACTEGWATSIIGLEATMLIGARSRAGLTGRSG